MFLIAAILKLADTYLLLAKDVADGDVMGRKSRAMTLEECYDLTMMLVRAFEHSNENGNDDNGDWYSVTHEWLDFIAHKYSLTNSSETQGQIQIALLNTERHAYKLVNCQCTRQDQETDKLWQLRNKNLTLPARSEPCKSSWKPMCTQSLSPVSNFRLIYNAYCRGDDITHWKEVVHDSPRRGNVCRYNHHGDPRLFLSPIKEEQLHTDDPLVVLFHDIVTDKEIQVLTELGSPLLKRASVGENGKKTYSEKRVGETEYLPNDLHSVPEVRHLRQRLAAASELEVDFVGAENLRISSYATSGYFYMHHDSFGLRELHQDNRLATILVYFNDVDGGETIFPLMNLKVEARKGTAVLFFNLKRSGEREAITAHGSCPIITGQKWIATQWIRRYGQEFKYLCGLDARN